MAAERKQLILVDGSGYIFRAFHALPPMNTSRGLPTQAVYGFIRMLLKLLKDVRPSHIAIVFDSPQRTFRDDLFADYKANRSEAPNDLIVQIPYIHRAVDAFRIKSLMIEADDVIGTLAKRAAKEDFVVTLITADKDFMQLVGPHVTLWNADPTHEKRTGLREVRERFGVEPAALIDIQALTGDQIDNVKGVPGVGEKTAAALVQKFGSVKGIYENLDRIEESGIRGAKRVAGLLAEHRAAVDLARKLVRIETDMPLKVEPDEFAWQGVDEKLAAELLRELEFNSIIREISPSQAELPGLESTAKPAATVSGKDLADAIEALASAPRIAVDLSASETGQETLQLASADQTVVVEHDGIASATALLSSERPPRSCHDLKNQIEAFARHGIALKGVDFDTMLAGFLINSGQGEPSLTQLYHEYLAPLGASSPPGTNAALVRNLREALAARLEADGLTSMYNEIEMPIAPILAEMETAGIGIDGDALKIISKEFAEEMNRLERECYELAGREFNLNSPIQLREVLFTHLKLSAKGLKKTKSGFSTDDIEIEIHVCRRALRGDPVWHRANPYDVASGVGTDRTRQLERPESAEYPDPQRRRAQDSPGIRAEAGMRVRVRRLFADRFARDGSPIGRQDAGRGVHDRRGHPHPHRDRGAGSHAGQSQCRGAAAGQGDKLRDYLRDGRAAPGGRTRDCTLGSLGLHQALLRAAAWSACVARRHGPHRAHDWLRNDDVRAPAISARAQRAAGRRAGASRANRHQHPHPGDGG
jgi:DNA polymerase-1